MAQKDRFFTVMSQGCCVQSATRPRSSTRPFSFVSSPSKAEISVLLPAPTEPTYRTRLFGSTFPMCLSRVCLGK